MGRQSRWDYFRAVYDRYRGAERQNKAKMLDEFCANTDYHRKYALRLLNGPRPGSRPLRKVHPRRPSYPASVIPPWW